MNFSMTFGTVRGRSIKRNSKATLRVGMAHMQFSAETNFAIYLFSFLFIGGATAAAILLAYHSIKNEG
ncbi:MAG: hypothetical protein J0I16_21660 [Rhizobiales bacterium]|nr:hypothetical protein [Hyphomicrobiales bacterium]